MVNISSYLLVAASISLITISLVLCSIYDMFSIFQKDFNSNVWKYFSVTDVNVQDSHLYTTMHAVND